MFMLIYIYVVGDYICLCAYMLLVVIYVMCIYIVGDYICLCAYMLLVNFSYMLLVLTCWCKHVLEYGCVDLWNSYELCFVVVES